MKKLFPILSIIIVALTVASCKFLLPRRFEAFVDRVENHYSAYSEKDWQKTSAKFEKLMKEYDKAYSDLSKYDRERIDKAIGRYRAIVVKSGVNSAIEKFNAMISSASSLVKGFIDGLGAFLNELTIDNGE